MADALGKVYLVGAGPGDPGLLTVRGRALIESADAIVYDLLVNETMLAVARPDAERVFVGKSPDRHTLEQDDINRILVDLAGRYRSIVRLKGGDPFVFGRGGEEAIALREADVPFEIVPGITAGTAVPAYAGIPVTHRNVSSSVAFVSGHLDPQTKKFTVPFQEFPPETTLVIFMSRRNMDKICRSLLKSGRSPDTPTAAIESGTMNRQRTVDATLQTVVELSAEAELQSPVILIVGDVVGLRKHIAWFEDRPLFGVRIALTQTRERSQVAARHLRTLGAEVFEFPTVEIASVPQPEPADPMDFDWIVLTSINSVDYLFNALRAENKDARDLKGVRLCAISTKTGEALTDRFIRPDAEPEKYDGDSVIAAMEAAGTPVAGSRVLFPRADVGRSSVPDALRKAGADVTELHAYEAAVPEHSRNLADSLVEFNPGYVLFGSASAARNFHRIMEPARIAKLEKAVYAAIGPIASEAGQELGLDIQIVPETHRMPALIEAIVARERSRDA